MKKRNCKFIEQRMAPSVNKMLFHPDAADREVCLVHVGGAGDDHMVACHFPTQYAPAGEAPASV